MVLMDSCFPSGFLGSLSEWPLPLSHSLLAPTQSPSVWHSVWKWENLRLPASGKLRLYFQPHCHLGQHRTLGGVLWNLLISVACHSHGS
ncbi:hypothetical protein A6R68_24300 [Neotoma lepida]|uniref:Uncharacterized protein n=1 Tax=Neotoma lepida TaxID=56216 RepID=A0A1A6HUM0_NEOLE|nr:hypothetical protein A6R68_24300 [Neotoma lepida]